MNKMEKLQYYINEMVNDVIHTDLNMKLHALMHLVEDNMTKNEKFRESLLNNNQRIQVEIVKEAIQHDYVLSSVIKSLLNDVKHVNSDVAINRHNALDEIDKIKALLPTDQSESNAQKFNKLTEQLIKYSLYIISFSVLLITRGEEIEQNKARTRYPNICDLV